MGDNKTQEVKKKHAGGRPTKYKPEYCQSIIDFFSKELKKEEVVIVKKSDGSFQEMKKQVANPMPFFFQWCAEIGINEDTMVSWSKVHPEFTAAYMRAKDLQKRFLIQNALDGDYDSKFSVFLAKNITDMRDIKELSHSGEIGQRVINVVRCLPEGGKDGAS